MNTSSGLSGSGEPRKLLEPFRYSCGILCRVKVPRQVCLSMCRLVKDAACGGVLRPSNHRRQCTAPQPSVYE